MNPIHSSRLCPDESQQTIPKSDEDIVVLVKGEEGLPTPPKFPLIVINEDFFYTSSGFEPSSINSWQRKNGWHRPINILMPTTLLTWCLAVGVYFGFLIRIWTYSIGIVLFNILIGIFSIVQLGMVLYCITVETQDDVVLKANKPRNFEYVKVSGVPVIDPENRYCNICQVHVKPETKHCKVDSVKY
jgi:hypothetical protein